MRATKSEITLRPPGFRRSLRNTAHAVRGGCLPGVKPGVRPWRVTPQIIAGSWRFSIVNRHGATNLGAPFRFRVTPSVRSDRESATDGTLRATDGSPLQSEKIYNCALRFMAGLAVRDGEFQSAQWRVVSGSAGALTCDCRLIPVLRQTASVGPARRPPGRDNRVFLVSSPMASQFR